MANTNYGYGLLGGLGAGHGLASQQQLQNQNATDYWTTTTATTDTAASSFNLTYLNYLRYAKIPWENEKAKPVEKKCSKHGELLHDLRREIDDWHGDILRAA